MRNPQSQRPPETEAVRQIDPEFAAAPLPQAALDDAQRLACLRLIRSENVGPVTFRELINHFGGALAALEALPEISRRAARGRSIRIFQRAQAEAELEAAARIGAQPLFTIEPHYPPALAHIAVPPPLLYVKGRMDLLVRPAVAIVGARNGSAAGMKLTRQFAVRLGEAGYVVASGLARGIDGAAHEAALASGTIAVLAGGIDFIYPPEHASLYQRIGSDGCLVSEQPPGFQPRGQDFPRRNRIISGISLAVVIVEAARRSGSLITARSANEQGRIVLAVPGHPLDPRAEGTNGLLKQGAVMATGPDDVLEAVAPLTRPTRDRSAPGDRPESLREAEPRSLPPAVAAAGLLPDAEVADRILAVMGPAPTEVDEIARATGVPAHLVRGALIELALAGQIEQHGHQLVSLRPAG